MDKRIDNFNLDFLGNIQVPTAAQKKPSTIQKIFTGVKSVVNSIPKDVKDAAIQKIAGNRTVGPNQEMVRYEAGGYATPQQMRGISFGNPMIIAAVIIGSILMFFIIKKLA